MLLLLLHACTRDPPKAPPVDTVGGDMAQAGCEPAAEVCNEVDDDCDGLVDDDDPDVTGTTEWNLDEDGDGYSVGGIGVFACAPPDGFVAEEGDCDDADAARAPDRAELCDDVDNDCDDLVDGRDDDLADGSSWYGDGDGDGHGDAVVVETSCSPPPGYVEDGDDCDDADAARHPDAAESCDGLDQDCDGDVDEGATGDTRWRDGDGDGYGDPAATTTACDPGSGWVDNARDCDDTDPAVVACAGATDAGTVCAARWGADDGQVPAWTGGCDPAAGFLSHGGHCYYAVDYGSSWDDARASCAAAGGHLATVADPAEDAFVVGLTGRVWLGGCDDDTEGTWTWVTGEAWAWDNWGGSEPNDMGGTEECLETYADGSGWNDIWCTYNSYGQGYACEFE